MLWLSDSGNDFNQQSNIGETKEALSAASNKRCFNRSENYESVCSFLMLKHAHFVSYY